MSIASPFPFQWGPLRKGKERSLPFLGPFHSQRSMERPTESWVFWVCRSKNRSNGTGFVTFQQLSHSSCPFSSAIPASVMTHFPRQFLTSFIEPRLLSSLWTFDLEGVPFSLRHPQFSAMAATEMPG